MIRKDVEGSSCGQFEVQITPWVTARNQNQYFILLCGVTRTSSSGQSAERWSKSVYCLVLYMANCLVIWKGSSTTLLRDHMPSLVMWVVLSQHLSTGTEETMMNHSWYLVFGLTFEPRPPKYKAEVLTMWPCIQWTYQTISNALRKLKPLSKETSKQDLKKIICWSHSELCS